MEKGYRSDSLITYAMQIAIRRCGTHRMAGRGRSRLYPTSGSGNQGIACTMPVVAVARKLGVTE